MWSISLECALAFAVVLLLAIHMYLGFFRAIKNIQNHSGYRTILSQATVLGTFLLPTIPGIALGRNFLYRSKHEAFKRAGWDIYAHISAWPTARTVLVLADAAAIKEVVGSRSRFPKPVYQYRAISFFGANVIASEGEQWKRYRKVIAPAFSDRNNRLVWNAAVGTVLELFETKWKSLDEIVVDHCVDITLPIALFVIGIAGFGRKMSWTADALAPPDHQMTFKDAVRTVSEGVFLKVVLPKWALGLTPRLRALRCGFDELEQYMKEMIHARRSEAQEGRYDLFSNLLDANDGGGIPGDAKLLDSELMGNIFIFLLAGHETTAHALCFTLAMLAIYQEEQEILYRHIKKIIPGDGSPSYEDMPLLTQTAAVFYETLRMFPPVNAIPKYSAEDAVLKAGNVCGDQTMVPVPQDTQILISPAGLHYNPRYWEDPHTFKPSRFLGDWPRDAFIPFSAGARACLGRKFFETEAIAVLTMLVSRYQIDIKEEAQFVGETFEQRKARICKASAGLTLTPVRVPLVFRRR